MRSTSRTTRFPYTTLFRSERLSENGVPCLIGDVKGDLGGFASKGELSEELIEHCRRIGVDAPEPCSFPVEWWCPRGKNGRSEEHTSELQSRGHLVCRLLLE